MQPPYPGAADVPTASPPLGLCDPWAGPGPVLCHLRDLPGVWEGEPVSALEGSEVLLQASV